MKKNNQKLIITISILAIIALMYNVLYFAIPFDRTHNNASFWITYGFTMAMIIAIGFVTWISFEKKELKSRIFGITIIKAIIFAGVIQFIFDAITMSIGNFFVIPAWITIVFEVLLLGFTTISLISRTAYRNTVDSIEKQEKIKTSCIDEIRIQSQLMTSLAKQKEYNSKLIKLNEVLKYCDPVSDKTIVDLENEILNNINVLKDLIISNKDTEAEKIIDLINNQIEERKLRLKSVR